MSEKDITYPRGLRVMGAISVALFSLLLIIGATFRQAVMAGDTVFLVIFGGFVLFVVVTLVWEQTHVFLEKRRNPIHLSGSGVKA
jgi:hypothetical protein